jgi:hypothetical protein
MKHVFCEFFILVRYRHTTHFLLCEEQITKFVSNKIPPWEMRDIEVYKL